MAPIDSSSMSKNAETVKAISEEEVKLNTDINAASEEIEAVFPPAGTRLQRVPFRLLLSYIYFY
ncbi:MAG: hypothetical protein L3J35_05860 [Bacteroidales bacterium]|nr:hypothetical protein [Bacteroidales bacterium]